METSKIAERTFSKAGACKSIDAFLTAYKEAGGRLTPLYREIQGKVGKIYKWSDLRNKDNKSYRKYDDFGPIREALNAKLSSIGEIDENWEFNKAHSTTQYFLLFYPKKEGVNVSFVETKTFDGAWVSFKLSSYNIKEGILTSVYKTRSKDDVKANPHIAYVRLEQQKEGDAANNERFYHFYTFSVQRDSIDSSQYIYGTFSRMKKDTHIPSAGVCLLKRCSSNKWEEALEELKHEVSSEIINSLYKRRIELTELECDRKLTTLPSESRTNELRKFVGDWEGVHMDSDLVTDEDGKGFLRTLSLNIQPSGKATIKYSEYDNPAAPSELEGFFPFLNRNLLYGKFEWDDGTLTNRIVLSLETTGKTLTGCYGGYSLNNQKPYAGAIVFKRPERGVQFNIENIVKVRQNFDKHAKLLKGFKKAHERYLNLPERCLSRELLSSYTAESTRKNNDITGSFIAYSLSSSKNAVIAHPISFNNGICSMQVSKNKVIETYTTAIEVYGNYVWLHFSVPEKCVIAFYCDSTNGLREEYYSGISYRINNKGRLQAKREIIIHNAEGVSKFDIFKLGSSELSILLENGNGRLLKSLLGREYNIIEVVKSHKIDEIRKRKNFLEMYLMYSIHHYQANPSGSEWISNLEQALMHGAILSFTDFKKTLSKMKKIIRTPKQDFTKDYHSKYIELSERLKKRSLALIQQQTS